jgi:hypothetical protein
LHRFLLYLGDRQCGLQESGNRGRAYILNGEPYEVQSFTQGVDKPVGPSSDFQNLLLQWNEASSVGKFVPTAADADPIVAPSPKFRVILSEEPIEAIWLRLRQLQSVNLATKLIANRALEHAVYLPTEVMRSKAEGVSYALRNATDYFHAREARTVSQRILSLYYGSLAFAFAEMLADPGGSQTLMEIENVTKQGHGLYTIDGARDGLEHLIVGIIDSGFFPAWMKAMRVDIGAIPKKKARIYGDLAGVPFTSWLTVERLFATIPELGDLFCGIFESATAWVAPVADMNANIRTGHFGAGTRPSRTYALLVDESARLTKEDIATFPGPISEIMEVAAEGGGRHFRVAVDHPDKAVIRNCSVEKPESSAVRDEAPWAVGPLQQRAAMPKWFTGDAAHMDLDAIHNDPHRHHVLVREAGREAGVRGGGPQSAHCRPVLE